MGKRKSQKELLSEKKTRLEIQKMYVDMVATIVGIVLAIATAIYKWIN